MKDLVVLKGKEVFTNSLIIAEGTGNEHRATQQLIKTYESDIKDFGMVTFEMRPLESGQRTKVYMLNEQQATFLISLMKNTKIVVDFKKELVRQFYAMRRLLQEQQSTEWKFCRQQGKAVRFAETDTLKELVEYAKARGSTNHKQIYKNYTRLANKTVSIKSVKEATTMQLNYLMLVENIFIQIIRFGMDLNKDYHDIYQDCKAKATQLSGVVAIGSTA